MSAVKPIILNGGLPRQMQTGDFLAVANGGTGATTASGATTNLLPSQTGSGGKVLSTDGSGSLSWVTLPGAAGGSLTTTSTTQTVLDSWLTSTIRTGKYVIQAVDAVTGHIHYTEFAVIRDDANNVYTTEYGIIYSNAPLFTITAIYNGTTAVDVKITPASTNTTNYKFSTITIAA
jgi:hypothetical protein